MSANDKFGLGYGDYRYGSILSYENEVLQSVFMNKKSDLENTSINDRYAAGMHAVPLPMTGNYMPSGPDVEIDYSKFTYGLKQTSVMNQILNLNDAPIIEEYESDSDNDLMSNIQEDKEKLSFSLTNSVKHVKTSRESVKETGTPNHSLKIKKRIEMDDPHRALKDKGIVNSGCSRHMIGNKAHLADYQEFKGGSIAFGGSNGRITGKEKIKAGRLDFEDVYYVEELKHYNLFSVSQTCDKKNNVLFTDTDCLVLSPEFKLPDENQGNLVRGLPFNIFENDQTCVACQEGKQHKASLENQANKFAGLKEANNSAGTQANDDQSANSEEIDLHEEHFVQLIWSAYSTTVKISGDKIEKNTDFKTCEKPVSQVKQIFLEELEKLKRQEKEANDATKLPRKEATHDIQNANTNNTNLLNIVSIPLSAAGPLRAFTIGELSYPDDPSMPHLEDIYSSPSEGIFTDSSYDDEGVFQIQKVWILVDLPFGKKAIRTKWVYKNKKDEKGVVVRNKERLVAQGHRQEEGIDYDEVFVLVARIKAIRIFLAFASYMGFIVYQMDVKSAFLYNTIDEEVYVTQPPGFVDLKFPNKVYKVVKALYGLHQAPRAWYATLSTFLEKSRYRRGAIDRNLFIKHDKKDIMLVQVYVDDIIFGSTKKSWCDEFEELIKNSVKTASTPIETQKPLVKDEEAADVDVHLYRSMIGSLMYLTASRPDIMFAVCACSRFQVTTKTSHLQAVKRIFRKSITGGCQFLGRRLIAWQCKKQTIVATSTTFWVSAAIKKVNDMVKLQALIDGKRMVVTEDVIRQALHLDDADGVECLPNSPHQDQSSFNQNYLQQPMSNPEDITDPTTAMNMALALMNAGNPAGYNDVIRNQVIQNAIQNPRVQNGGNQNGLIGVQGNGNQNQIGNGNLVAARAEGNAAGQNGTQIRCYNCMGVEEQYTELLEPIPESHQVPHNDNDVISEDTSMEQGGETVEQHPTNVKETRALYESLYQNLAIEVEKVNSPDSFYHTEQKMPLGYQKNLYLKQAQKKQQCLYDGKVLLEKHDPPVVHDSEETLQLAQESRDKMKQMNKEIKPTNYTKINHFSRVFVSQKALSREELYFSNNSKTANVLKSFLIPNEDLSDDTAPSVARKFLNEEAAKFVRDFKSLANEADASLAKHKALELEIERLLKAVVSQDIMIIVQNESVVDTSDLQTKLERTKERFENRIIKKETEYAKLWNDWYKKCDECKYDKISYDKAYKDMQQKIKWLQAQLGDLKGKSKDTSCVSDT
nr:hypothetical protein [Tanacetum cinerariifolium]